MQRKKALTIAATTAIVLGAATADVDLPRDSSVVVAAPHEEREEIGVTGLAGFPAEERDDLRHAQSLDAARPRRIRGRPPSPAGSPQLDQVAGSQPGVLIGTCGW